jgi:hypothetical protein
MSVSSSLANLIDRNAPFWTAEAEIFRAYWEWEGRSRETDRLWLVRQSYKEFWDGFVSPFEQLKAAFEKIDRGIGRHEALDFAATLHEEFAHYVAFADAYEELLEPGDPRLDPEKLRLDGDWPENGALVQLRKQHKEEFGDLGHRAHFFTEGGYCTLYAEGMKLAGRGGVDDLIAMACKRVFDDEFEHMLKGIIGLDAETTSEEEWESLAEMTVAQMQYRIHMRNAQFSYPVEGTALDRLVAGDCPAMPFDWKRAGLTPPS